MVVRERVSRLLAELGTAYWLSLSLIGTDLDGQRWKEAIDEGKRDGMHWTQPKERITVELQGREKPGSLQLSMNLRNISD